MSDELKPCKRCGGKAMLVINDSEHEYDWDWFVQCKACYERTDTYSSIDKAIAAWNKRADDAQVIKNAENYKLADDSGPQVIANAEKHELADSREKLEADIKKYRWEHGETSGRVAEWLDRQAAITEQSLRGKIRTIRKQNKKYRKQIAELTAERDELRDIIDHMPKTEAECEACQEAHDRLMFLGGMKHQELQTKVDKLAEKLHEKQHVCDIQRDSFAKMEREYRELQDVCGELERTLENLRGD